MQYKSYPYRDKIRALESERSLKDLYFSGYSVALQNICFHMFRKHRVRAPNNSNCTPFITSSGMHICVYSPFTNERREMFDFDSIVFSFFIKLIVRLGNYNMNVVSAMEVVISCPKRTQVFEYEFT